MRSETGTAAPVKKIMILIWLNLKEKVKNAEEKTDKKS